MKTTKTRNLFLILAACCLGVGASIFSNLNPIGAMYADNITYGMTFSSSKNKLHNYSGATPHSGEATVKTNLGNNINFEYKDLMGVGSTWHVAKTGGYFTNLDPINGLEKINVSFKTNNVNYKIYWSYSKTFNEENVYTGISSTSSPLNFVFNRSYPSFFKFENVGGTNLNISEINFEFTCLNGTPTINVESNDETLGTVSGGGTFVYGEKVTLTALPNDYCEFIGWYANDYLLSKDTTYVFFAEQNLNIIGRFAKTLYYVNVEINDSSMGKITGEGGYTYGEQVVLTASPYYNHIFLGWYKDGVLLEKDFKLSFIMYDCDLTYEAKFAKTSTVNVVNENPDLGNITGGGTFIVGTNIRLTATPNAHCEFLGWYENNILLCKDLNFDLIVSNDINITAKFSKIIRSVTVSIKEVYMGTVSGAGSYVYGEQVDLVAIPKSGYSFFGWYNGDNLISQDDSLSFLMEDYDIHYEARFVKNYKITIINDFEEMGTVESASECGAGLITSVKAIPNDGYKFIYWCDTDLNVVSDSSQYSFTMPNNDITLYPIFEALPFGVSIINYNDNYVSTTGAGTYLCGEEVEVFADFQKGEFLGWYLNNELVSTDNPYKFKMTPHSIQLEARWHNFTISGNILKSCPKDIKFAYIPDTVTSIGELAFYNCSSLTSITIPDSVTSIGYEAFRNCSSLTSITIPDSVTSIGYEAFRYCSSLTSITIGNSVKSIGSEAFYNCSSLTNVYYKGTLEDWCNISFYDYYSNPMYYADHFYMLNEDNEWYEVTEIVIPDTVTKIGNYQFYGFNNLTSAIISDSVKSIGSEAFYNCSSLTNVYYKGTLEDWCNISFSNSYSNPMSHADHFYMLNEANEWYEVTEIVIPDTVTKIGNYQFYGFNNLTSVIISDSVTSIGERAFSYCSSLTSITIPDSVTSIGVLAFYICSSLTSITIPDSVTSISERAFSYCSSLTSIFIPDSVTSIGYEAFRYCSSLTSITIGNSVKSIGSEAFYNCSSLTNVYYKGTLEDWCNISFSNSYSNPMSHADHFYMLNEANEWYEVTEIVIPDTVTKIGDYQFLGFDNMDSVTIGNSVTSIGRYAFSGRSSLTSITIPDSVTSIGERAFSSCSSLTSIIIPDSVTSIGASAFSSCSSLTNVYYKDTIEDWCDISFYDYYSNPMSYPDHFYMLNEANEWYEVTEIVIPDTVTKIGSWQFCGFDNITSVTIGNSVTSIGAGAFYNCSSLTLVTIGNSVTSIGASAFSDCSSLTSIFIPDSVTSIGASAFSDCSSLTNIDFGGTTDAWGKISFGFGSDWKPSKLKTITCNDGVINL